MQEYLSDAFLKEKEDKLIGNMESIQEEGTIKKGERQTTRHGQHLIYEFKKLVLGAENSLCVYVLMCRRKG